MRGINPAVVAAHLADGVDELLRCNHGQRGRRDEGSIRNDLHFGELCVSVRGHYGLKRLNVYAYTVSVTQY